MPDDKVLSEIAGMMRRLPSELSLVRREGIARNILSTLSSQPLVLEDEEICKALDITDEEYLGEATAAFGGKDEGVVVDFMPLLKAQIAKLTPIIAAREQAITEQWKAQMEGHYQQECEVWAERIEQAYNKGLAEQGSPRADLENELADKEFAKKYRAELCKLKAVEQAKVEERKKIGKWLEQNCTLHHFSPGALHKECFDCLNSLRSGEQPGGK